MRLSALVILVALFSLCGQAGVPGPGLNIELQGARVEVRGRYLDISLVIFSAQDFSIKVIDNAGEKDTAKYPDLPSAMKANGCVAGCNGGFFSRKPFTPVGGMISDSVQVSHVNRQTWMKGLLVVRERGPALEAVDAFDSAAGITDLLQSGTWLVRAGKPETDNSREKIARRTFIGYDAYGRWVLGASSPCTLQELAAALRAPEVYAVIDVQAALNLDGGPSTGLWLMQSPDNFYLQELWPVRNYVGIVPRHK